MTDTSSPSTVKARLPRGFADRGPAELGATNLMLDAIRASYELYGFEAVETPFVEYPWLSLSEAGIAPSAPFDLFGGAGGIQRGGAGVYWGAWGVSPMRRLFR